MNNSLQLAVDQTKHALLKQKKKVMSMRSTLDDMLMDLEQLGNKLDTVVSKAQVYADSVKNKLDKMRNEFEKEKIDMQTRFDKQLQKFEELSANSKAISVLYEDEPEEIPRPYKIASTVTIFQTIVRCIVGYNNDDMETLMNSFIFPVVYQRLVFTGDDADEAYYLSKIPDAAKIVVSRGKEYLEFFRSECDQHLTEEEPWGLFQDIIVDWLRNDALPLIYQQAADDWKTDVPLTRAQMLDWENDTAGRAMIMPEVVDALEVYKAYKDEVYTKSGARAFEYEMLHAL